MKKRNTALLWMLIVTAVLIAALGAYLKYGLLRPLELYQDESIVAVPFLLMADEEAKYTLRMELEDPEPTESVPAETEASVTETVPAATQTPVPTDDGTEPPTEPPVQETEPEPVVIDESWFDDALFIGDSRTQGLSAYGRLGEAHYFCEVGMTVYNAPTVRCSGKGFSRTNLPNLLSNHTYGKIYINLGLNEIMGIREKMLAKYQELIDMIREKQPDAVIILQGVMTVTRSKAASAECFSLESIYSLNEEIAAMAVGENMRYIDVNEWIADEEGYLPDDISEDGSHLYGTGYQEWGQWFLENAATLGIE